jgi:hypothetical protein
VIPQEFNQGEYIVKKILTVIWGALSVPIALFLYFVTKTVSGKESSLVDHRYLLRQLAIGIFVVVVYTDITLLAYHTSDFLLSCVSWGVSYIINIWNLPEWRIDYQWVAALSVAIISTGYFVKKTFRTFAISVPEYAGVLTVNYFGGRFAKYSQGLSLRFPWERIDPELCFSLEIVTVSFEEDYVTKDGGVAIVKGSYRYAPSFERLEKYGAVDEKTIGMAILNLAKSDLTVQMSGRTTQKAREETSQIKAAIEEKYKKIAPIEDGLGFDFEDFTFADIAFDKETQNALSARFASTTMFEPTDDAAKREDILVLAGKAEKKVTQLRLDGEVRGLENIGPALAAMFASLFASKGKGGAKPVTP